MGICVINLIFKVYIQNLRAKQPEKPRRLFVTIMGKESKRFTRCFHGWGPMRTVPAWDCLHENFASSRFRWPWCAWSCHIVVVAIHTQNIAQLGENAANCTFLSTIMHIRKHVDSVHCPNVANRWPNWSKISLLQLCCFKCIYPPFPERSLPPYFRK